MKISYRVPFKSKAVISDHWEIPFIGGTCRVIEKDGFASSLEMVFTGQPLSFAPRITDPPEGLAKLEITMRNPQITEVKKRLDDAIGYIQCIFDIELATDEIETKFEGETPEEEEQIEMKSLSFGRNQPTLNLSYDLITRAIMASEASNAPIFEATLLRTARKALFDEQYINSFRYSFLLIEALYGDGQFKSAALKITLKRNDKFRALCAEGLKNVLPARSKIASDTQHLLERAPSIDEVIEHLVDKRGFYFHGNIRRADAWKPDQQKEAERLASVAFSIAGKIAFDAMEPLFAPEFAQRHFDDARQAGAIILYNINFVYRDPEDTFDREQQISIRMPGTKPTPSAAFQLAKEFFRQFEHTRPTATLKGATCKTDDDGEKIFEILFHVSAADEERSTE